MTLFFSRRPALDAEREDENGRVVARHDFVTESSLPQILELVAGKPWFGLDFLASGPGTAHPVAGRLNPKRARRAAAQRRDDERTRATGKREREVAGRKARRRGR